MKRLPRLLLCTLALFLPLACAWAQTATVTATPGTCVNADWGTGTETWSNTGNALTQNDTGATVVVDDSEVSEYLRCTNYGFAIPAGVTISGITVTVRRQVSSTAGGSIVDDQSVRLVKAGTVVGSDFASGTAYTTAWVNASYGGTGNLWGSTWTPAEINAANFGVTFAAHKVNTSSGTRTVRVDVISVAVTYTDNTPPTVNSIVRADASPTSGVSSVSWTVTFSEPVTGVNAADFTLVQGGGLSGASITSVIGSGTTWTVTANPSVTTGTLGLNLVDDDSVQDSVGNRLGGTGANNGNFTGEVYTVTAAPCSPPSNIPAGLSVSCICDNFNRSNLNPSPIFGQDWITTESDGSGVLPSIVNSNYLRLTDNSTYKAKAATAPAAFPAAGNYISVELLHYAYNGSGADGMVVTLSDYNVPAVPGAYGGSLGYAQQTTINGFAGGWIGVALDEYGNYQNPTEGRIGGPGLRQDSVAIRGSGSGTTGYRWLQGTAANLSPAIDVSGAARGPGYRYQIIVDARNAGAPTPQTFVTLNRDTTGVGNNYTALISSFDAFARAVTLGFTQAPVPANWQISLTASTGASTNIHEIGGLRICASTIVPPSGGVASGFAVIDEAYGTPPIAVQNYLTGRIYTKVAGTPFKLNVAAINNNQIQTGYVLAGTKNVNVKLVDNSDGVCVLNSAQANYCSAACQAKTAVTGGSQTLTFTAANAGQRQSADFTVPGAWSNLVALVGDGTTINANGSWACSTDAFSVRPPAFTSLSTSASNSALTGTPALRAGTDTFTMTVGTSTAGYAGASAVPTLNNSTNPAFTPPRGVAMSANTNSWTLGTVSPGTFPAATASSSTGTFTYSEVGHFQFLGYNPASNSTSPRGIYDSTWTSVDQGVTGTDCISGNYANTRDTSGTFASNPNYGKYGCNFGITSNSALFGRFTPDHFVLVPTTSPAVVSPTITPACNGTTRNYTYMDQPGLRVAYRLEARNGLSTPSRTVNYDATLFGSVALPAPSLVAEDTAYQGCDLSTRLTTVPNAARWNAGVYDATTTTGSPATTTTTDVLFSRPAAPSALPSSLNAATPAQCSSTRANAGNPFWALDLGALMVDGAATTARFGTMNPGTAGDCTTTASCTAARLGSTSVVLGRLNLLNAFGSDAVLQVPVRAEYWNGSAWQLNTDDRCTSLTASALAVGNVTQQAGSSLAINSASVNLSPTATLVGGSTNFRITPSTRGTGAADVVLNLGFGVNALPGDTDWCGTWNAGSPIANTGQNPVPNLNYLSAVWCNTVATRVAPSTRVRFGIPRAPYIYLRERY